MNFIEKIAPGIYGGLICRTRYMDDVIKAAIDEGFEAELVRSKVKFCNCKFVNLSSLIPFCSINRLILNLQ